MGWPTERIFLPLLKTTASDLIDYHMPENGVFHNLITAKMKVMYKGHAKQFMHAFWGAGQMSFVKHAIFLDEDAPELESYEAICEYVLQRFSVKSMFITEGILDALDHSSPETLVGGKLGIDATVVHNVDAPIVLDDEKLFAKIKELVPDARGVKQFMTHTKNPITVISVAKSKNAKEYFEALVELSVNIRIVVFVDEQKNDITNPYMLVWRVTNNIDAQRDVFISGLMVGVDGTNKTIVDGFSREWPDDVDCTQSVVDSLKERNLWDLDEVLYQKYQL
jgi:4-hydroxy-3-polyprenylbenzoate decarboxylase